MIRFSLIFLFLLSCSNLFGQNEDSCFQTQLQIRSNRGSTAWASQDTICIGDTLKVWFINRYCPMWASLPLYWVLDGIDGNDTLKLDTICVVYSDTGLFERAFFLSYSFSLDSQYNYSEKVKIIGCPPTANFISNTQKICANNCIQFTDKTTRMPIQWHWYFEGGTPSYFDGKEPPPVCYTQAGKYKVSLAIASKFGVDSTVKIDYIEVSDAPEIRQVDTSFIINYGESQVIDACALGKTYLWSPDINCSGCSSVEVTPDKPENLYQCIVISADGCEDTCYYLIKVEGITGTIYVPNAFSPNGDNKNEVFEVFGKNVIIKVIKIFNRWGEMVYSSDSPTPLWDGRYRGQDAPTGIYTYQVQYLQGIEQRVRSLKGSITLIR